MSDLELSPRAEDSLLPNTNPNANPGQSAAVRKLAVEAVPERAQTLSIVSLWGKYRQATHAIRSVAIVIGYVWIGIYVSMKLEGWSCLSSLYVITQIVTTIGYGDMAITHESMRWFMTFYVLFGIAVVGNIVNSLIQSFIDAEAEALRNELKSRAASHGGADAPPKVEPRTDFMKFVVSFATWLSLIVMWTAFFTLYEGCTCSYGKSLVEDCVEGDMCPETGGVTMTWDEAVYMAVITMTTVGFGDFAPKTRLGRGLSVIFMFLGVIATMNFITNFMNWIDGYKHPKKKLSCEELFHVVDKDGDGTLAKREFRMFALLQQGLTTEEHLNHIDALFDAMDKDNSGSLTHAELTKEFEQQG